MLADSSEELRVAADFLAMKNLLRIQSWPMILASVFLMIFCIAATANGYFGQVGMIILPILLVVGILQRYYPSPVLLLVNGTAACSGLLLGISILLLLPNSNETSFDSFGRWFIAAVWTVFLIPLVFNTNKQCRRFGYLSAQPPDMQTVKRLEEHIDQYMSAIQTVEGLIWFTSRDWFSADVWHAEYTGDYVLLVCCSRKVSYTRSPMLTEVRLLPTTAISVQERGETFFSRKYKILVKFEGESVKALITERMLRQLRKWLPA